MQLLLGGVLWGNGIRRVHCACTCMYASVHVYVGGCVCVCRENMEVIASHLSEPRDAYKSHSQRSISRRI